MPLDCKHAFLALMSQIIFFFLFQKKKQKRHGCPGKKPPPIMMMIQAGARSQLFFCFLFLIFVCEPAIDVAISWAAAAALPQPGLGPAPWRGPVKQLFLFIFFQLRASLLSVCQKVPLWAESVPDLLSAVASLVFTPSGIRLRKRNHKTGFFSSTSYAQTGGQV